MPECNNAGHTINATVIAFGIGFVLCRWQKIVLFAREIWRTRTHHIVGTTSVLGTPAETLTRRVADVIAVQRFHLLVCALCPSVISVNITCPLPSENPWLPALITSCVVLCDSTGPSGNKEVASGNTLRSEEEEVNVADLGIRATVLSLIQHQKPTNHVSGDTSVDAAGPTEDLIHADADGYVLALTAATC